MGINLYSVRGKKCYTKRYASVTTAGQAISFSDVMINEALIHIEGATSVATLTGDTHTDTAAAVITSDGVWIAVPKSTYSGGTIITIKAPTGTINVSVVAWGD